MNDNEKLRITTAKGQVPECLHDYYIPLLSPVLDREN